MERHKILDDWEERNGNEPVINGTWVEWWRGLIIGMIILFSFSFLHFKILDKWYNINGINNFHFEFIGLTWNIPNLTFSFAIFAGIFSSLFFTFAWKQSIKRVLLLGFITSIINPLSLTILPNTYKDNEKLCTIIPPFLYMIIPLFFFFIITALLFKRKYRHWGIIFIILTFLLIGLN